MASSNFLKTIYLRPPSFLSLSLSLSLSHLYLSPQRVEKGGNWITTFLDLESFNTFQAWTEQTIDLDSKTKQNLYDEIKMAFISDLVVMG